MEQQLRYSILDLSPGDLFYFWMSNRIADQLSDGVRKSHSDLRLLLYRTEFCYAYLSSSDGYCCSVVSRAVAGTRSVYCRVNT